MGKKLAYSLIVAVLVISFVFTGFSPAKAAQGTAEDEWQLISQIGGSTQAVAVMGRTAFAGVGLTMNIVSFADPAHPSQLGTTLPFGAFVTDIAVFGSRAYVADGAGGLSAVDVSDTAHPKVLGTWASAGYAEAVAVQGSLVALADGPLGLRFIDFSAPAAPKEMSAAFPLNYAQDVALAGQYAFVAAGDSGLLIADISDSAQPVEVASLDTSGFAYGVTISGSYAYIADGWAGIETVDISDPTAPKLLATTPANGWALSVALGGNRLYTGNGGMGTQVFDLSDPASPQPAGIYNENGSSRQVAASGSVFFVADTLKGLRMIDAADPDNLVQLGIYGMLPYARRAHLNGDFLYVNSAVDGAMYVINVADPSQPYQVSTFQANGNASDVQINGQAAYLMAYMDTTNYTTAIDISDPTNLSLISALPLGGVTPSDAAPRQAALRDNTLFVADEFGLRIFDVSDPANIRQYGQIQTDQNGNTCVGVVLNGDYAYLAASGGGVRVIDISDVNDPKEVAPFGQVAGSLALQGDKLYIGTYGGGVQIASIGANGASLNMLGSFPSLGQVEDVAVSENELFVNEGLAGIQVLDVSNPAQIALIQTLQTPGYAWSAEVNGNYLYVSDGNGGLLIYAKAGTPSSSVASPTVTGWQTTGLPVSDEGIPHFPEEAPVQVHSSEVCTVTSSDFSGPGTLFECLSQIQPGGTIDFDTSVFSPTAPATIMLEGNLPELTAGSITIDGSNAGVVLDGNHQVDQGLVVSSSYNTVMGLQFTNFNGCGIQIGFPGTYNTIGGDHTIGAGPAGQGNAFYGNFCGVSIAFCHHNTVKGNFIGTLAGGTQAGPYTEQGVYIGNYATYNFIGGASAGEKNIISGNNRGVDFASNTSMYNTLAGNYVGTDVTGTKAIPNYDFGVILEVGARFNIVGGTTPEERNIISGNNFGLTISDDETTQNTAIGNYIGTDVTGTKALPNKTGMTVYQALYNRIGGALPGEGNLISGNSENALAVYGMGPINAIVEGNTLGLDVNGQALPNGNGIYVYGGSHSFIGGLSANSGNLINGSDFALHFETSAVSYNWVAGNTLNSNNGLLIDNQASHIFAIQNDASGSSTGYRLNNTAFDTLRGNLGGIALDTNANQGLSAPRLNSDTAATITGTTCAFCTVDFFTQNPGAMSYLEAVTADASGGFTFISSLSGVQLSATVTDLLGNTSAFSPLLTVK